MKKLIICAILYFMAMSLFAQQIVLEPDSLTKKSILKFEFFSPLSGNTTIGYERYIKDFTSVEAKLGIIGLGKNVDGNRNSGVFLKVGPKFKLKPEYATEGTFGTHLLRGSYIRPEIGLSVFDHQENERGSKTVTSAAILINYGKQYILGRIMSLDWHIGLGYGFSNDGDQGYYFGYSAGDSDFPMAISAGFTLGVLLR